MCLCLGLALVVYLVVCYDFSFDGVSRRVCPKGDFVCPSGTGCGCIVLVFNRLWLTCVPEGSGFLPFGNVSIVFWRCVLRCALLFLLWRVSGLSCCALRL